MEMELAGQEPDGMEEGKRDFRALNRDVIKYIAMFTMLLNHISHVFLSRGTFIGELFEDAGYFTAVTMCYFLVEGYEHTRSRKKYGLRLLVFAVVSQFPFSFAFSFGNLNMIFTLFICFLILVAREKIGNKVLRAVVMTLLVFMTINGDWPLLAAIYTILFANFKDSRKMMGISYGISFLLFVMLNVWGYIGAPWYSGTLEAVFHGVLSGVAIPISGVVILFFYNGKRAEHGRVFSQWFFYLFYPVHLLVIGAVERLM